MSKTRHTHNAEVSNVVSHDPAGNISRYQSSQPVPDQPLPILTTVTWVPASGVMTYLRPQDWMVEGGLS